MVYKLAVQQDNTELIFQKIFLMIKNYQEVNMSGKQQLRELSP